MKDSYDGHKKTNITFRELISNDVIFTLEEFLNLIERFEDLFDGRFVGVLGRGKTGTIDAIWFRQGLKILHQLEIYRRKGPRYDTDC